MFFRLPFSFSSFLFVYLLLLCLTLDSFLIHVFAFLSTFPTTAPLLKTFQSGSRSSASRTISIYGRHASSYLSGKNTNQNIHNVHNDNEKEAGKSDENIENNENEKNQKKTKLALNMIEKTSKNLLGGVFLLSSTLLSHPMDSFAFSPLSQTSSSLSAAATYEGRKANFIASSLFEKGESSNVLSEIELGPPSKEQVQSQKQASSKTKGLSVSFDEERKENQKLASTSSSTISEAKIESSSNDNNVNKNVDNKKNQQTLLAKETENKNGNSDKPKAKYNSALASSSRATTTTTPTMTTPSTTIAATPVSIEEEQKNLLLEEFQDPERIIAKGIILLPNRNDVIGQQDSSGGITAVVSSPSSSLSSSSSSSSSKTLQNSGEKLQQNQKGQNEPYLSIFSPARDNSDSVSLSTSTTIADSTSSVSTVTAETPTLTLTASSLNYALENDDAALLITCYGREGGPVAAKKVSLRGLTFPYQFEITVDNLLFPQTRSSWVKDVRSTDDLGISALLDLDGQFATANENDYIGFGISKPFSIAGANLRKDAMITVQPRTGVKEYSGEEVKVLGNIDFELSRQESGAGLAQLEEKKLQASIIKEKQQQQQQQERKLQASITKEKKEQQQQQNNVVSNNQKKQ